MAGGEKILKNQRFFDRACRCALARICKDPLYDTVPC